MVNDTSYMFFIITFFLASAIIVPLLQEDLGVGITNNNHENVVKGITNSSDLGFFESLFTSSESFETSGTGQNPEINVSVQEDTTSGTTSPTIVLKTFFKMFFWTFGQIPPIIDLLVYVPLRMILLYLIVRFFRGNG